MGRAGCGRVRMRVVELSILWLLSSQIQGLMVGVIAQVLQTDFYDFTCPAAKQFVKNTVQQAFLQDNSIPAALIRLLFHDCFNGCDASVMLDGLDGEKVAVPNLTLRGFEVINDAKVQIEALCPGIVSCSDILVLAATNSVEILGGPSYEPALGRLDSVGPGPANLPTPQDDLPTNIAKFQAIGLDANDVVILLGAHSVGKSQCKFFSDRLYNFQNTGGPDPALNGTFLAKLRGLCPVNGTGTDSVALDDQSEFVFDTKYFGSILDGQGVLQIDSDVTLDPGTRNLVSNLAGRASDLNIAFGPAFVASMDKMSRVGLKTLVDGQVRRSCASVNL